MGRSRANIYPQKNVSFDKCFLLTRKQQRGETMGQFHSALSFLAEHFQLGHLKDELLRDIFTANMINREIQKELLKITLTTEKALEQAVSLELRIRSQLAIKFKHPSKTSTTSIGREKTVMEISSSRQRGSGRQPSSSVERPERTWDFQTVPKDQTTTVGTVGTHAAEPKPSDRTAVPLM